MSVYPELNQTIQRICLTYRSTLGRKIKKWVHCMISRYLDVWYGKDNTSGWCVLCQDCGWQQKLRRKRRTRTKGTEGNHGRRNRREGADQTTHRKFPGCRGPRWEVGHMLGWRSEQGQFSQAIVRFWLCWNAGSMPLMLSRMHQGFSHL